MNRKAAASNYLFEAAGLRKEFDDGQVQALRGVDLRIAEGEFVIQEDVGDICFDDAEVIHRHDGANGNDGLVGIGCYGNAIDDRKGIGQRLRISGSVRRVLIFSAKVEGESSNFASCAEADDGIETLLIRPAIIVDEGLAKMEAVS